MLPASRVRPHSLTTLALISAVLMMFASLWVGSTCSPGLAGVPLVPWALMRTPWALATARRAEAAQSNCLREGILIEKVITEAGG